MQTVTVHDSMMHVRFFFFFFKVYILLKTDMKTALFTTEVVSIYFLFSPLMLLFIRTSTFAPFPLLTT